MKKIVSVVLIVISLVSLLMVQPALAAGDAAVVATGAKVFSANCAACHAGGNNLVNAAKNLKAATLHQYGMDSLEAITTQVTNGKASMPAFKGRLKPDQIEAVAAYVLDQAEKDWKG